MNVSNLAPIAKAVVAAAGSVILVISSLVAIASLFADGVLNNDELFVLWSNITIILAALGLPVAVYKVPNRGA